MCGKVSDAMLPVHAWNFSTLIFSCFFSIYFLHFSSNFLLLIQSWITSYPSWTWSKIQIWSFGTAFFRLIFLLLYIWFSFERHSEAWLWVWFKEAYSHWTAHTHKPTHTLRNTLTQTDPTCKYTTHLSISHILCKFFFVLLVLCPSERAIFILSGLKTTFHKMNKHLSINHTPTYSRYYTLGLTHTSPDTKILTHTSTRQRLPYYYYYYYYYCLNQ